MMNSLDNQRLRLQRLESHILAAKRRLAELEQERDILRDYIKREESRPPERHLKVVPPPTSGLGWPD